MSEEADTDTATDAARGSREQQHARYLPVRPCAAMIVALASAEIRTASFPGTAQ